MRRQIAILFFLALFSLSSCSNYLMKQEEERQRNNLSTAIINSSTRGFTITVYPVKNMSKNTEIGYISKAIAEILVNYLRPLQNEELIIPYEYKTNQEIRDLVLATNSVYSNYITNIETVSTQYIYHVFTNYQTNFVAKTNWTERFIQKKKTKEIELSEETNFNDLVTTNVTIAGITTTNQNVLTEELFHQLVNTEFPDLTNMLSRIPVTVIKDLAISNTIANDFTTNSTNNAGIIDIVAGNKAEKDLSKLTNGNTYKIINDLAGFLGIDIAHQYTMTIANLLMRPETNYAYVYGSFTAVQNKNGPNDIQLKLTVLKHIGTNQEIRLNLNSREDLVSERLYELLKPIRKFILDRPTGDMVFVTDPDDANVYMDGTYIGKSPLYYPAVLTGNHQFTFLKPGFTQSTVRAEVLEDRTNMIRKIISKLKTGGTVVVNSEPSNANVFVESTYVGNTPLTLSNLTLNVDHRVKIMNTDTNMDLPPYYNSFKLQYPEDRYRISANLVPNRDVENVVRQTLWWTAMGSWGITLGFVGLNIYAHYQSEYNFDYFVATGRTSTAYYDLYASYAGLDKNSMTGIVISTLVSLGFTAIMLYNNEVYLGMNYDNNRYYASASIRF